MEHVNAVISLPFRITNAIIVVAQINVIIYIELPQKYPGLPPFLIAIQQYRHGHKSQQA